MPSFDKIVQNASESLLEDECLRSNLTDSEAKVVMDWAMGWIAEQVKAARDEASARQIAQAEVARVRQTAVALNALAAKNATPRLADALAAMDSGGAKASATLTREQVLTLATAFARTLWTLRVRAGKK
jgi:hypothetical protein